jgi:hypothetical protein
MTLEDKYELYQEIYNSIISIFSDSEVEIIKPYTCEFNNIDSMKKQLECYEPISTKRYLNQNDLLKKINDDENHIVDSPNNILDIVYSGWFYLLTALMPSIDKNKLHEELNLKNPKRGQAYSWKYDFLINNLSYSIDTSIIVKNIRGK